MSKEYENLRNVEKKREYDQTVQVEIDFQNKQLLEDLKNDGDNNLKVKNRSDFEIFSVIL